MNWLEAQLRSPLAATTSGDSLKADDAHTLADLILKSTIADRLKEVLFWGAFQKLARGG
jgi:hypothetical protein